MSILEKIDAAGAAGHLMASTVENIRAFLAAGLPAWAEQGIGELVEAGEWAELNDRFYTFLAFGTGGMRGRTVGRIVTASERGAAAPDTAPAHAAIGSNVLNDFTLIRAVIGLYRYTKRYQDSQGAAVAPKLVIAHDVRNFSHHFCELAASTWVKLGGEAAIFDGPRPTPQLSFAVRSLRAQAGIVITASHNPPHDNGFKAYFDDGAQVVPPHDKGIVDEVNAVPLGELGAFLDVELTRVQTLDRHADDEYLTAAATALLDAGVVKRTKLRVVFTNIHGTGAIHSLPLLIHAGCHVNPVPEQLDFDARFPTVKSPNPENAEALSRGVTLAEVNGADVVLATDPDADRMGVAVRNRAGKMELLTGNQIGSLLTEYRLAKYKEFGVIPAQGSDRVAIVKTFVTTRLQDAIGEGHGVKVINTLTGFKWIAAKQRGYEDQMLKAVGDTVDVAALSFSERAKLLQQHATFYAFGTEESYGYLPNDYLRDKDGNSACLMFAELCSALKERGVTVGEFLDEIYLKYGFFLEGVINLYYEGATGSAKIKRILETYRSNPPKAFGDVTVKKFEDFGRQDIRDADGELVPKQDLYFVTLSNGYSFAARGSGTEPKMKFYLFANAKVGSAAELPAVKAKTKETLDALIKLIEADAKQRAES
ncbi:MAG: hypothetical protein RIS54_2118 [Verrucomicrobiota bacterium]|jgi:phosphoglucomutase